MHRTPGRRERLLLPGVLLFLGLLAGGPAPAPLRAQAPSGAEALDRAAALRRQGRWPEALDAFRRTWAAVPPGPDKTAALAFGRMALLAGDSASAVDPLREAADSGGPLAPYGKLLLAEALLETGRAEEAEALAARFAESSSARRRLQALSLLARAQDAQGKLTPRLETLGRIAALSSGPARDRALWERAQALLQLERGREAGAICRDLYARPSCVVGREAGLLLRDLAAAGRASEPALDVAGRLDLCRRFLKAGRREDAWDLLQGLPEERFEGPAGEGAALLRIEVLHALRRNAETVRSADALAAARGPTEAARRAALKAVWALVREGDHGAVADRCRVLLEVPPKGHEGLRAEALNAWAASAYASGRFEEAQDRWAVLEAEGGPVSLLRSARYRRAWSLVKTGRFDEALPLFRSLAEDPGSGPLRPFALWGAAAACRGAARVEGEREALLLLSAGPDAYWRAAAVSRLSGIGVPAAPPAPALLPPAWSGRAGEGDGTLARALDRAGLEAEAADAFAPVFRKAGGTHPEVAFTYALLCGRAGLRAAAAAALEKASPGIPGTWALPDLALEALYPAPDLGRVRPLADAEGVSTALVLGVMLQESGFDEAARSPAGARGLMQVMPETASRLRREGEAEADLHDPAVSAALGARYLARLLARFPTAGAVAAYNAGEDVVARWMAAWSPASEEEFVAMIPYAETRAYTARVLAYSRDYARRLKSGANEGGERPEASPGTASIPPDTGAAFPRRDRETLPSGRQA